MIVTDRGWTSAHGDAGVSPLEVWGGITALKGRTVSKLTHFSLFCVALVSHVKSKKKGKREIPLEKLNTSSDDGVTLPGSWNGTKAKLYSVFLGRFRDVSKILDAPSMTWTRSSYMEPVTSKTNARVDAPSGISSLAPLGASCPAQSAADSAMVSHSSPEPISQASCTSATSLNIIVLLFSIYSKKLSWFEALRHRALRCGPQAADFALLVGVVSVRRSGSLTPLSQLDRPDRQSRQLQKRLLSEEAGALVQPCHTKTTSQLGKESPQAQSTPIQSVEALWLAEGVWDHYDKLKSAPVPLKTQDL